MKDMKVDEITSSEGRITETALSEGRVSLVPEGSVLFVTRSGTLAHTFPVAVTKVPVTINQDLKALTPRAGVLPNYVAHPVRGASRPIRKEYSKHGTTVAWIETNALLDFEIPLLDVGEQRRIVAEIEKQFSRLDEAVANLKRVKLNAARPVGSVLVDAVAGKLVPTTETSWRTVQVSEAGDVLLGRQRVPQYLTGRWSYLRVANIKDDAIDFSDVETMGFDEAHFAKYRLAPGDILVSEGQSPELLRQSAIFHGFSEPLCFQKTLHRFRAFPGVTTPQFAQIVFRSHVRSGVFRRVGSITTNIGHLTLEKFKSAPFPLPPLDEQHRIVAEVDRRLSTVREVVAAVDANLKSAVGLRQAVLTRAYQPRAFMEPCQ
ncbi:MAG TPA: restriction endonuclease subunit S [Burkholderiales bacterium]|nr:restriction endonuclease subunit S [Burkholderiales bacterium]